MKDLIVAHGKDGWHLRFPSIRPTLCKLWVGSGLLILAGCKIVGMNATGFAHAWDEFRCDRRAVVFVNLQLDTTEGSKSASVASYHRALAYFHDRGVSEVIFEGRTTAHGTLAEFRALNAGFSTIPDPAYRRGHATVTWNVKRTYRFAPEDAMGKYHPSTFWSRIFNSPWSDSYIAKPDALLHPGASSMILLKSYYGERCRVQEMDYVTRELEGDGLKKKTVSGWEVLCERDETISHVQTIR